LRFEPEKEVEMDAHQTLSAAGTLIMVTVISSAVVAMITVLALAARRSPHQRSTAHGERATARCPGLRPEALRRAEESVGDPPGVLTEPGGHAVGTGYTPPTTESKP
jgi:hypothetical protein